MATVPNAVDKQTLTVRRGWPVFIGILHRRWGKCYQQGLRELLAVGEEGEELQSACQGGAAGRELRFQGGGVRLEASALRNRANSPLFDYGPHPVDLLAAVLRQ